MAKQTKKKNQVEEEELELEYEEAVEGRSIEEFLSENRNLVLGIAGGIILLIVGFLGFRFMKASQNTEAQELMVEAPYYFEQDSLAKALNGDNTNYGFLDIANDFGGTKSANQANYYAGVISLKQGNAADAIDYLNQVSSTGTMLDAMKHIALANAYLAQGDFRTAADNYSKAARLPKANEYTTPQLLLKAGETYELAGETGKAASAYRDIKNSYPKAADQIYIEKYLARVGE